MEGIKYIARLIEGFIISVVFALWNDSYTGDGDGWDEN